MLAERIPPLSLFARVVSFVTRRWILRAPRFILALCILLAGISGLYSWQFLQLKTSRLDLLNPHSDFHQRWVHYLEEFGEDDDAVLVVEGHDAKQVARVLKDLGRELDEQGTLFRSVLHQVDTKQLQSRSLYMLDEDQLQRVAEFAEQTIPSLQENWEHLTAANLLLSTTQALMEEHSIAHSIDPSDDILCATTAEREGVEVLESLLLSVQAPTSYRFPGSSIIEAPQLGISPTGHLTANDGKLGFILVSIARTSQGILPSAGDIQFLKRLVEKAAREYPDVEVGLTGLPILEHDEMQVSQQDMTRATLFSLFAVSLLFIVGFGHWRLPLLAVASLMLALSWSFGYITASVGHLNILSISFGAILIGLGIDFGIHLLTRFTEARNTESSLADAITKTVAEAGPGLTTGAVTTSLAFGAAAMTHFTGIAELGVIAGGGVLLCLVAALVALPALLMVCEQSRSTAPPPRPLPIGSVCRPATRHPRFALVMTLLTTLVLATGLPRLEFDHNLLNLQPEDLESVVWERRLLALGDQSVWFAVSMADSPEEILDRKEALLQLPSVSRVEEIASYLAPPSERMLGEIQQIREILSGLPESPPPLPLRDPMESALNLQRAVEMATAMVGTAPDLSGYRQSLRRLREAISQLSPTVCGTRLQQFESAWARDIWQRLEQLAKFSQSAPPELTDLPASWRERFMSEQGHHLMRIFGQGDIWNMDRLERFVREVERVDPQVTGHPVQTFYASRQMQRSYIHAAIYAMLAVMIVLILDFRSLRVSILALVPLTLGILQLFGLLGLLGIPLNAANMIVLPLIIGIGLDDGVHVVHDYRRQRGLFVLGNATASAIVLTSATTMLGFGSLMVAHHQGLRSLGQVLTIGVFCCMISSLVTLPALLALRSSGGVPGRVLVN
jgi:uncharacterized protein